MCDKQCNVKSIQQAMIEDLNIEIDRLKGENKLLKLALEELKDE